MKPEIKDDNNNKIYNNSKNMNKIDKQNVEINENQEN